MQTYRYQVSQINKLKSIVKNKTKITLKLSRNMIGTSNNETNFLHRLLLPIDQPQIFLNIFQIIHQLIKYYQKLIFLK